MKILVIGGSYFLGRWFVELAHKKHSVTVLNRGSIKVGLPGVTELVCDRHDAEGLKKLSCNEYDAVVDLCAYKKGDIEGIINVFGRSSAKYIFVSTVDVYEHSEGIVTEDSPLRTSFPAGPEGEYLKGKAELEKELEAVCEKRGMNPISVRPAVLYGPANYAPREKMFFDWISRAGQIILPSDSDGLFYMTYASDAALAILDICEKNEVTGAYNLVPPSPETYESFAAALHAGASIPFTEIKLPVKEIEDRNIPMPFPIKKSESYLIASEKIKDLGVSFMPLDEGIRRTFSVYLSGGRMP